MADKVQLIKEEIERLKEHTAKCGYPGQGEFENGNREGRNWVCDKLLQFINSLPEEPASEDLEEAAEVFYNNCNIAKSSWWDEGILHKMSESKETFIAGVEWQKKQMMKDAVECIWGSQATSAFMNYYTNIECGDKVKIIILKTEQQ